jgi:hypothetical protein
MTHGYVRRAINPVTGWYGGFTVVLGNPPWDRVKLQEQEFFAIHDPDIANAHNASARKKLIAALPEGHPTLHAKFLAAKRRAEGESHVLRNSGRFPLSGRGDVNTYAVFTEGNRSVVAEHGRLGIIVPTGIATDATTQYLFKDLLKTKSLASLYDFQTGPGLWSEIGHARFKFCLLTIAGRDTNEPAPEFAFFMRSMPELHAPDRKFHLTPEEITLLNPNTGTCPVFRSRRDAEITLRIYRQVPVLVSENDPIRGNPWGVYYLRLIDAGDHRDELRQDPLAMRDPMPVREAKSIHQFDHRFATYRSGEVVETSEAEKSTGTAKYVPRSWVERTFFEQLMEKYSDQPWFIGYRDIARATDVRMVIASALPRGPSTRELPILGCDHPMKAVLLANLNAFAFDYVARQKNAGTHVAFFLMKQFPVLHPDVYEQLAPWSPTETIGAWVLQRVCDLVVTDPDLSVIGTLLDGSAQVRTWDTETRARIRAELDAAYFHLYGVDRDDVDFILETFPIVKRKDISTYGEYYTKRLILDAYDKMQEGSLVGATAE